VDTFELAAIEEQEAGKLILKRSHMVKCQMKLWKKLEADNADDYANDYEDGLDEDDLDMFEGDDSFEDFGFEENWN
jgi:hypothetical protein